MKIREQSRGKGSEEVVINRKYCLEDFPGSMGESTDSEISEVERPESGTTRQITGITMAEEEG